jgi:hypothetical protein
MKQMRETSDKENLVKSYDNLANSILPETLPYITYDEARKASRLLARKFGNKKDAAPSRYGNYPINLHIRKCWVCLSGDSSLLSRGWRRLIHDLAHRLFKYRSPSLPDHCALQAEFEGQVIRYVLQSGWLDGKLKQKPKAKISSDQKKEMKITKLRMAVLKWERKIKLANTFLKKYKSKLRRATN